MHDGERVKVTGSTGAPYELSRQRDVYACTCPAWTRQRLPTNRRTCKHLRAHLGDSHEDTRTGDPAAAARIDAAQTRARKALLTSDPDPPALRARRKAALAAALARFPAAAERMRTTYGMPLPRHLAYAVGFWLGLTDKEREEAWAYFGCGPAGVAEWFEPDGLGRAPQLDERLHFRYRCDPPEFVTVFTGNSDGSHYGLWYDEPHELPRLLAHNWARDTGENGQCKPTLLACLRDDIRDQTFPADEWPHARAVLRWLDEVHAQELVAHRDEKIPPPPLRTNYTLGGLDPIVRGARIPEDYTTFSNSDARLEVLRTAPTTVRRWISQALDELAAGEPMRALFLARDLHWFDNDAYREQALDLGVRAYQAVGRPALAEVLRVHVAHRDLSSVGIYAPPPVHPLVDAVQRNDHDDLTAQLAADPPQSAIVAALLFTPSPDLIDRLLPLVPPAAAADKLAALVSQISQDEHWQQDTSTTLAALDHLIINHPAIDPGPAYVRALAAPHPALALRLAALVDLARPDADGLPPLHRAVQSAAVPVARLLLGRGADRLARDAHGKTPHDHARDIWQSRRAESLDLLALLPAPAPVRAASPVDYAVGDTITHVKFGPGVIRAREGAGDATKLTIDFNDAQRQLLAKYIRRA